MLRYIERNPTRARMVALPEEYRWSSVLTHLGRAADPLITQHEVYLRLGADAAARAQAYGAWLRRGQTQEDAVRQHLMQERALGDPRFQAMVERALGRPAACRARGRPRGPQAV